MSTSTPADRGHGTDQTRTDQPPVRDTHAHPDTHAGHTVVTDEPALDRRSVLARQKEEHGGVKIGSAFFGFLTAVGVGVLLTALVSATGAAVGLASDAKPSAV